METVEITQKLTAFRLAAERDIELPSSKIELSLSSALAGVCEALQLNAEQAASVIGYSGYGDMPAPFPLKIDPNQCIIPGFESLLPTPEKVKPTGQ